METGHFEAHWPPTPGNSFLVWYYGQAYPSLNPPVAKKKAHSRGPHKGPLVFLAYPLDLYHVSYYPGQAYTEG